MGEAKGIIETTDGYSEAQEVGNVKPFIDAISSHIDRRMLDSSSHAKKLQKTTFESLKTGNITSAWRDFLSFKNGMSGLKNITLPNSLSDNGKRIILEAVYSNFAKDNYILDKAGITSAESLKRQKEIEKRLGNPLFIQGVKT